MARFELYRIGCGRTGVCSLQCGGPNSCRRYVEGELNDAITEAKALALEDPMDVFEVRLHGDVICTVAQSWISRRRPTPAGGQGGELPTS